MRRIFVLLTVINERLPGRPALLSPTCMFARRTLNGRPPQLEREITFVDKWLTSHVSDHSALNHRKNVFSALAAMSPGENHRRTGPRRLRGCFGRYCLGRLMCAGLSSRTTKERRLRLEFIQDGVLFLDALVQ